jgi:hypothetical protein
MRSPEADDTANAADQVHGATTITRRQLLVGRHAQTATHARNLDIRAFRRGHFKKIIAEIRRLPVGPARGRPKGLATIGPLRKAHWY